MTYQLQRISNGKAIALGTALAGGGEGKIYTVGQTPSLVAKVYHKPVDERRDKLSLMLAHPPYDPMVAQGHVAIAWPVDLLSVVGDSKQIVGFLMRRVTKMRPIHEFYTPKSRRQHNPLFNYLYLHRTARNLAAAVGALHASGYVIGDVNESNILISDTALVTLVDTDSFQVRDAFSGVVYRCRVGKPEFTPPEIQGQTFHDITRTPEHDLFGLAVLIFQLLMEGVQPFAGIFQGSGEPPSYEARICAGHFPYGTTRVPYLPPPLAPPFEILHPTLRQLFVRCFESGHYNPQVRPDAQTWVNALESAENALLTCAINKHHRYGNHLNSCPWCERTARLGGSDLFAPHAFVQKPLRPAGKRKLQPIKFGIAPIQHTQSLFNQLIIPFVKLAQHRKKLLVGGTILLGLAVTQIYGYFRYGDFPSQPILLINNGVLLQKTLNGHSDSVLTIAISPDGNTLASGSSDKTIKLWNLKAGQEIFTLKGHSSSVESVAFSPDGKTLASGSSDNTIKLWNVDTGQEIITLNRHSDSVRSVAFSPDGKSLASGSRDKTIELWTVTTGQQISTLKGHSGAVESVAFSSDGKTLASGSRDKTIKLWNLNPRQEIYTLHGHSDSVLSVAFLTNKQILASGSSDNTIKLWNLKTYQQLRTLRGHSNQVYSLAVSGDENSIASGSADKTIKLWNVFTGENLGTLKGHSDSVNAVAYAPSPGDANRWDGKTLASGSWDYTIKIWRVSP